MSTFDQTIFQTIITLQTEMGVLKGTVNESSNQIQQFRNQFEDRLKVKDEQIQGLTEKIISLTARIDEGADQMQKLRNELEQKLNEKDEMIQRLTQQVDQNGQEIFGLGQHVNALQNQQNDPNAPVIQQAIAQSSVIEKIQKHISNDGFKRRITIGGSKDLLYPVWFRFPDGGTQLGKMSVIRYYSLDNETNPLGQNSAGHQYGLLMELEGNATVWSGNPNVFEIKRFGEQYANGVSHVQYMCYAHRVSKDNVNPPDHGSNEMNYVYNGFYLRGGGLSYDVYTNWEVALKYHDGNDPHQESILHEHLNSRWVVRQIRFADLKSPTSKLTCYK